MKHALHSVSYLAPALDPVYAAITAAIGETLGLRTRFSSATSAEAFAPDAYDLAFVCGLPVAKLAQTSRETMELIAVPVLAPQRYGNSPIYFSDIIVRQDTRIQTFTDTCTFRWACNEQGSHSGYNVPMHAFAKGHHWPASIIMTGSHRDSLEAVRDGRADVAAIDSHLWDVWQSTGKVADIHVVDSLGPSPIPPVIASTDLPLELRTRIRQFFLDEVRPDRIPELSCGLIDHFTTASVENYTKLAAMASYVTSQRQTLTRGTD